MLVRAKTIFKHGRVQFDPPAIYDVPPKFGGYFVGNGWAEEREALAPGEIAIPISAEMLGADAPKAPPADGEAALDIRDGVSGASSRQRG